MHENHPCFSLPDDDVRIWRFMDFAKFADLIFSSSLFFNRIDKFQDPWEGMYPAKHFSKEAEFARIESFRRAGMDDPEKVARLSASIERMHTSGFRTGFFINCWHVNAHESEALWRAYGHVARGVAIQTTVGRLKRAFAGDAEHTVYIGKVGYIDYNEEVIPVGNIFWPTLFKRKSFEHERELRVVHLAKDLNPSDPTYADRAPSGMHMSVDLDVLIENVYVDPRAGKWFEELVARVVEGSGASRTPIRSTLFDPPRYLAVGAEGGSEKNPA